MTDQTQYRQGDRRIQAALGLLVLVAVLLVFYLQGIVSQVLLDVQLLLDSDPVQALKMVSRLLLWLVVSSALISIVVGSYLCLMAVRIARCGEYPPSAMPVAFRTRIRTGIQARKMRWLCLLLGGLLFLQPLLGLALWYGLTGGVL